MKQSILQKAFTGSFFIFLLVALSLFFTSYKTKQIGEEMWKMLGISKQTGTAEIRNSFLNGYLSYYSARNAKNLALSDRAAIAKDLLSYTKEYIGSAQFKKEYDDLRKGAKPVEPEAKPARKKEDIQKEEIAKTEKSIREMQENMKTAKPDVVKVLEPVLDMLKKTLKDYQDPNNELFKIIADSENYSNESRVTDYKESLARWEKEYPAEASTFIKTRLLKMLELTAGIDYQAALIEKYGKKRFVNTEYERKSTEWKQGFRAGKDVTEPARLFVKQWVAELK